MKKPFNPAKYYGKGVIAPKTPERAPEQPQDQRLSPSGTTRAVSKKGAERARQECLKAMEDLGL